MAIAIFPSLEGESLEDFSIRLAERWRIGRKGLDNGVILLVFVKDRQVRLEVGYGLEGRIPDAVADQIIRQDIVPRFREGRYADGLDRAVAAVYARIEGTAAGGERARKPGPAWPVLGFFGLLGLVVALFAWEAMSTRRQVGRRHYSLGRQGWYVPSDPSWRSSGGWGGFGGGGSGGFSGGGGSFGGGGASGRW